MKVNVQLDIEYQKLIDLVITGLEGGTYSSFELTDDGTEYYKAINNEQKQEAFAAVEVVDRFADGEEAASPPTHLTDEVLFKGLQIFSKKYPQVFAQFWSDNYDVITADVFLQCAVFGDCIYG